LKTVFFDTLISTQTYLKELLHKQEEKLPLAIVADIQTQGVGSRDNSWVSQKGNLFLSFALELEDLPNDLKLESVSIYFAQILKETLAEFGSKLFVKWPNDLYIQDEKIGGMITNIVGDAIVCGVGLNLASVDDRFSALDVKVPRDILLQRYFTNIEKKISWKQVFSKYKLEFQTNKRFFTHFHGKKIPLSEAVLENDGSININGERIYSQR